MPRASAASAAQTAQNVLGAATELFASFGFNEVSVDDVAEASGVTRGAVYHHFRSKQGLFREVAARLQSTVASAVVESAEKVEGDASDQFRAGAHAFLDAITTGAAVRILLVDAPSVIGWQEWRRLDEANSVTHLRESLAEVGVPAELLGAATAQLSGAMNEAALWVAQHADPAGARRQAHTVLDRLIANVLQLGQSAEL
ncbi:helix-turn-helix domain-containing protein [Nesterenkonia rhizosphaerae]|uniref:TetR/AcrR family transcriptional regulator n=1 Tax=Nesterenkonia rhizosphaerae TaxID=1348272 RepID=A0ABP9FV23_9MICC